MAATWPRAAMAAPLSAFFPQPLRRSASCPGPLARSVSQLFVPRLLVALRKRGVVQAATVGGGEHNGVFVTAIGTVA